jgi:TonB-linked SusC/RagA family outer membrane protein
VVIDGVPRDNFVRLDPNEIESLSVLKDASASIYGVRAANGVLLITTKKGQRDSKFKIDYTGYYGITHILHPAKPLDAVGFMELMNEKSINGGGSLQYTRESFEPYWNGTKQSTDWMAELLDNSPQTYHNISASGGTKNVDYFVSFGYNNEVGAYKSGDLRYDRYNLRSNVSAQLAKGLKTEVLLNLMTDHKTQPSLDGTYHIFQGLWTNPTTDPYYANDNPEYPYYAADGRHPEMITYADKSGYQNYNQRLIQTNLALEWEIPWVKGLKTRGMYSYDYTENENKIYRKAFKLYTYNPTADVYNPVTIQSPSYVRREYTGYINSLLQFSVSYNNTFNKLHNVSALALYEESNREADNFWGRRDLSLDDLDQMFTGNTTNQQANMNTGDVYHLANKALVARLNYDYASKYLVEFSFRYDGSSKFASGKQWGFFPSAFVGWRLSEESFIKNNDIFRNLNNLKLRASYGLMGDDSASSYQFLTGYNYPSGGYVFDGTYTNGISSRGLPNTNLTWYKAASVNLGLDAELWNGLLGVTVDIFQRDRSGLLATRAESLPGVVGANLPQENLNSDMTRGLELTLTHRHKIADFTYSFSGNMALSRTMTKHNERAMAGNSYDNWRNNTNDRWNNVWWGHNYQGQFQSFDEIWASGLVYDNSRANSLMLPGDLIYEDWNGDGIVDNSDFHPFNINNSKDPILIYGFTLGGEYKGFDLALVFSGAGLRWTCYEGFYTGPLLWGRNGLDIFLDRWHRADQFDPESTEWIPGKYPSTWVDNGRTFVQGTPATSFQGPASNFWVQNSSYLRLKSLELGYTIPGKITRKAGMERARLFFNAYNLLTFTKMGLTDPEKDPGWLGMYYPLTQSFNFGINVSF